ncbi:hypothetical protein Barb7_00957 [Bacteroidales bacterium Barb7]|nr:hypothetical protein Barb7_00957 [Bacteroidales bacterium Barb7]
MNYRYELERYNGKASRYECPKCGDARALTLYIDKETRQPVDPMCGRCNHESDCGYHCPPGQYFQKHPQDRGIRRALSVSQTLPSQTREKKEPDYIPSTEKDKSVNPNSDFIQFLSRLFNQDAIDRLVNDYALEVTKNGDVIFWQIDFDSRVRTGKIMKYDNVTGKRMKDVGGINWIHATMKKQGLLPENFNLVQCLFGEHLLRVYPEKTVALVESEKTALVASAVFPQYVWLATGGKFQLSIDKLKILQGRTVAMFPDADGYNDWEEKAKEIRTAVGCTVIVSHVLEKKASEEDKKNKIDIADWLIRQRLVAKATEDIEAVNTLQPIPKASDEKPKEEAGRELQQYAYITDNGTLYIPTQPCGETTYYTYIQTWKHTTTVCQTHLKVFQIRTLRA